MARFIHSRNGNQIVESAFASSTRLVLRVPSSSARVRYEASLRSYPSMPHRTASRDTMSLPRATTPRFSSTRYLGLRVP